MIVTPVNQLCLLNYCQLQQFAITSDEDHKSELENKALMCRSNRSVSGLEVER
jgi:hypothetical protein